MRTAIALAVLLFAANAFGQQVDVFARGLEEAGSLLVLDDGTVLVTRPTLHDVLALRDRDGDGRVDEMRTALSAIPNADGLAIHGRTLYVSGGRRIVAAERRPDGGFDDVRELVADLSDGRRTIGVSPEGRLFAAGPTSLLLLVDADYMRIFARGDVRGFAWHPATKELWSAGASGLRRIGDGARFDAATETLLFDSEGNAFAVSQSKIARVRFKDGKPLGREDYASIPDARLTGAAVANDGALFVSDERGIIYRINNGMPKPMTSSAAAELPPQPILTRVFRTEKLGRPAAVVHDEEQDVYFVSTLIGVARVTPDGRIDDETFIEGLRRARGLAIRGTELWVADGTTLHVYDRVSGALVRNVELGPRGANALTGIAVGSDDLIYVTDTGIPEQRSRARQRDEPGRIFRIEADGDSELMLADDELRAPSGIVWDGMRFLVAQSHGREVLAWTPGGGPKAVLRGAGSFAGLMVLPSGAVLVASQQDDAIHIAHSGGELRPLFTRTPPVEGLGFDRKRNRLLLASPGGDSLEAWTLPPLEPRPATDLTTAPPRALSAAAPRDTSSTTR